MGFQTNLKDLLVVTFLVDLPGFIFILLTVLGRPVVEGFTDATLFQDQLFGFFIGIHTYRGTGIGCCEHRTPHLEPRIGTLFRISLVEKLLRLGMHTS